MSTTHPDDLSAALAHAAQGLLFPSESDAPLVLYRFPGRALSAASLLSALGRPADTPVAETNLDALLAPLTRDAERPEESARWQALLTLLKQRLTDLHVYRVGEVDIDVYVLGQAPDGTWLGLQTHVVET